MLYEAYQNKINRIAKVLSAFVKMLPYIIAVLAVIAAAGTTLMASKGSVIGFQCSEEITYGNLPECSAKGFLSDVQYEYRKSSESEWQAGLPKFPGTYAVRAVGTNIFGNDRYSKEKTLLILPKALNVRSESEMEYGDVPKISAEGLVFGDRIVCEGFISAPHGDGSESTDAILVLDVTPDAKAISIFDENGNDVTSAYRLLTETMKVSVVKRNLSVQIEDISKIYDGTPLSGGTHHLTSGSLLEGDALSFTFTDSQTNAGVAENLPSAKVFNANGEDVTAFYRLEIKAGKLIVEKRPVSVTTGSKTEIYSANAVECPEFTVDPLQAPLADHTIVMDSCAKPIHAGAHKNIMEFHVVDVNGVDQTANYALNVIAGTIEILPRPITVTTGNLIYLYDGSPKLSTERYTLSGSLISGHRHQFAENFSFENAGVYENKLLIEILDAAGENVTENYEITYAYGTLTIEKVRITVITPSLSVTYDGTPWKFSKSAVIGGDGWNEDKYKVQAIDAPSIQRVGTIENCYTVKVLETEGDKDVTENFEITYQYGTLTMTPRPLTIQTGSETWTYDGESHTCTSYVLKNGTNLAINDTIENGDFAALKDVGEAKNEWGIFDIKNKNGESVLSQYQRMGNL